MTWLEHKVPPPILLVVVAAAMWWLSYSQPGIALEGNWQWPAAVGLALSGLLIAGAGVRAFARHQTTINPVNIDAASALVTNGIFAYTRNPMYLGMVLVLLGWAVFLGKASPFLGPALFALFITRFQIVPEERVLRVKFDAPYESYTRKVPRWM